MKKDTVQMNLQQRAITIAVGLLVTAGIAGYLTTSNIGWESLHQEPIPVAGEDRIFLIKALELALPDLSPQETPLTDDFRITDTEYPDANNVVIDFNDGYSYVKALVGFTFGKRSGEQGVAITSYTEISVERPGSVDRGTGNDNATMFEPTEDNPLVIVESDLTEMQEESES